VQDFEAFVQATNHDATKDVFSDRGEGDGWRRHGDSWKSPGFRQTALHPVTGVSYDDAQAFCAWLTKKERDEGKLTANQRYRLPTDEEWSLAVGLPGETAPTPKERSTRNLEVFPWGLDFPPPKGSTNIADETARKGRHRDYTIITGFEDGFEDTAPVGSFTPNKFGLHDLSGNVWEWCEDFFDGKAGSRVMRGGAYSRLGAHYLESPFRLEVPASRRRTDFGFRCVIAEDAAQ
jgi:formylglycine-generating enzyme required for sulfatase activity